MLICDLDTYTRCSQFEFSRSSLANWWTSRLASELDGHLGNERHWLRLIRHL